MGDFAPGYYLTDGMAALLTITPWQANSVAYFDIALDDRFLERETTAGNQLRYLTRPREIAPLLWHISHHGSLGRTRKPLLHAFYFDYHF